MSQFQVQEMDFINKLISRPKSLPANIPISNVGIASDLKIETLLEINENLNSSQNQVGRILF